MSSLPLTDGSVEAVADAKLRRVARKFQPSAPSPTSSATPRW